MKPTGLTADFRIVKSSRTEDLIWDAVEEAVHAGWDPTRFVREARQAWANTLADDAEAANKEFDRLSR
jgi:hypothetical protein